MRIKIGQGERVSGYVTLGPYAKSLRIQAFTQNKQLEFERFVRDLYRRCQIEPARQKLTPREFLDLLPRRLRGITWAVAEAAPLRRARPTALPLAHSIGA